MTLPPVVRVFFAIDLPETTKTHLGRCISLLKKQTQKHSIRWSRIENLHITLQFLGQVQTEHLPKLIENVKETLQQDRKKLSLTFGALHCFPSQYRPRVLVLEVNPQAELAKIAENIGQGILKTNYEVETRPFKAHLTLGRFKHAEAAKLDFLAAFSCPELGAIPLEEVILFRSEPHPEGSSYSVIERLAVC